jgi:threonine dehydrogenase-like Zn-dependent dehydrogenase
VDPVSQRLRLAEEFGADEVFTGTVEEFAATRPEEFDVAIVATPHSVIDAVAPLLRPRSRIVVYGGLDIAAHVDVLALHRRSISLIKESEGINGVREARDLWSNAVGLVNDGILALHRLRTHTFGFDDVETAFRVRTSCADALHVVCAHPGGSA